MHVNIVASLRYVSFSVCLSQYHPIHAGICLELCITVLSSVVHCFLQQCPQHHTLRALQSNCHPKHPQHSPMHVWGPVQFAGPSQAVHNKLIGSSSLCFRILLLVISRYHVLYTSLNFLESNKIYCNITLVFHL